MEGASGEGAEFFEASAAVGELGAVGIGIEEEFVVVGEAVAGKVAETGEGSVIQAMDIADVNTELGFGIDFVDILAARAAGSGKGVLQVGFGNPCLRNMGRAGGEGDGGFGLVLRWGH